MIALSSAVFFQNQVFLKIILRISSGCQTVCIHYPDQAQHFVRPDLSKLSADDKIEYN